MTVSTDSVAFSLDHVAELRVADDVSVSLKVLQNDVSLQDGLVHLEVGVLYKLARIVALIVEESDFADIGIFASTHREVHVPVVGKGVNHIERHVLTVCILRTHELIASGECILETFFRLKEFILFCYSLAFDVEKVVTTGKCADAYGRDGAESGGCKDGFAYVSCYVHDF